MDSLVTRWPSATEPAFRSHSRCLLLTRTVAFRTLFGDNRAGTMKAGVAVTSANSTAKRLELTGPTDLHINGRFQYGIRVPPLFPVQ
jgi:hypothetical protein